MELALDHPYNTATPSPSLVPAESPYSSAAESHPATGEDLRTYTVVVHCKHEVCKAH